jgi:alcohol dehydrogenase (cytochrome c)
MRRSTGLLGGAAVVLGISILFLSVNSLRSRAQVIALKLGGKLPELAWPELFEGLRPDSPFYLAQLIQTRSPYRSFHNPATGEADLAAGRAAFRERCSSCHGADGAGGVAPALVDRPLTHGGSDWALYLAISRGIPGTGMAAQDLPQRTRWQIVAYVQQLRVAGAATASTSSTVPAPVHAVTVRELIDARADSASWLTYSGAYDGWRYSTLSQITRANVHRLRVLWIHQIPALPGTRLETSPIAVDGVLFITTPSNGVLALDAGSGSVLWSYQRPEPTRLQLCCGHSNRGLAILGNTLFMGTLDAHLVALDARTGAVRWDIEVGNPAQGYSLTAAPLVVKDLVVIGTAGGEFASRGFIAAYDAETGRLRWKFYTIPAPGAPGNNSWSGDSWKTGGGPAWLTGSYDPALDLIYWGTGNPNPDYNGDSRLGDNLYTSSVVALEPATGALRWYFQYSPHDVHDWDAVQIPLLVNAPADGRPLLLSANRNGFFYVLDRATGRFIRGQPFALQTWADGLDSAGRPLVRPGSAPSRGGTLLYPSSIGATNWWSPTYSPRTGLFYIPTFTRHDFFFSGGEGTDAMGARMGGGVENAAGGFGRLSITAIDALSGDFRWKHEVYDRYPRFSERVGGLLSTAGDVVFGGGNDLFLALDANDGTRLWTLRTGVGVHAAPITYLVRGRQQVTVAAGGALLTFGLDELPDPAPPR